MENNIFVDLDKAITYAERQTETAIKDLKDKFKPSHSTNNIYPMSENDEWTNGMWTGEINIL